jgi:hypothetical protein
MLRRNFLRNAAFTLPVALVAPNVLMANEQDAPQATGVILVGGNDDRPGSLPAETLAIDEARNIVCNNQGFVLTDKQGKRYSTQKIIFTKSFQFCDTKARVHIQTSDSASTTFSIQKNGRQSAACWVASNGKHAEQVLPAFMSSKKAAIMCLV